MALLVGTISSDRIFGTNDSDSLYGLGGNDLLEGFAGNDYMSGGEGFDTADYSRMGRALTLLPRGLVSKNGLGFDQLSSVEQVVGASGYNNAIDGSSGNGSTSFDINLGAERLAVNNVPGVGTLSLTVRNFVSVRGTQNSDVIVGSSKANYLDGQAGNDILIGSGGNDQLVGNAGIDILNGTSSSFRGFREIDQFNGGSGSDGFVLGDRLGSFYRSGGSTDYALIKDFSSSDRIQLGAGEVYQVRRDASGFDLFVIRNGVADLVADVRTTSAIRLPSGAFRLGSNQGFSVFIGA